MKPGGIRPQKTPQNARIAKRGISEKPCKTPGFNPGIYSVGTCKKRSFLPFQELGEIFLRTQGRMKRGGSEKKCRQSAMRGSGGHYMHLNFCLFWLLGRVAGLVYRRRMGFTTVAVNGIVEIFLKKILYRNFRKKSKIFFRMFFPVRNESAGKISGPFPGRFLLCVQGHAQIGMECRFSGTQWQEPDRERKYAS